MINLLNGRGQIGNELSRQITDYPHLNWNIYHTWNFINKERDIQEIELNKFKDYINNCSKNDKIVYISTSVINYNWYYHYKLLAELYLLENFPNGYIIKLPNLLGKGICTKFRDMENIKPFGIIEILNISDACKEIIKTLQIFDNDPQYKIHTINGEKITATMLLSLIQFGKHGSSS